MIVRYKNVHERAGLGDADELQGRAAVVAWAGRAEDKRERPLRLSPIHPVHLDDLANVAQRVDVIWYCYTQKERAATTHTAR